MNFALFENTLAPDGDSLIFHHPYQKICLYNKHELTNAYQLISQLSQAGYFLLGYIAYDLAVLEKSEQPLLYFIAFKSFAKCPHNQLLAKLSELGLLERNTQLQQISAVEAEINHAEFFTMFEQVQDNLRKGNSYQINLTKRFKLDMSGLNSFDLYYQLSRANPVNYACYCNFDEVNIISISPELFFHKQQNKLITRPMKGTIAKGLTTQQSKDNHEQLANDNKNRAENLIIVDLLRNDLAKIAKTNSVKVNKLFSIEEYNTVFQMTSEIEAQIDTNTSLAQIITGLFPCGSITGAPKKRTIELIEQIEQSRRNIYTGAVGYILPHNDMLFNVAIRTITKYTDHAFATLGAGGGITIQSQAQDELNEIHTKIKFLTNFYQPNFNLVESMLIRDNQIINLNQHLTRLANSAQKLLFPCDIEQIETDITKYLTAHSLDKQKHYKLRLELDYQNTLLIEHSQISHENTTKQIAILNLPLNTQHFLFAYKTTAPTVRGLYDKLYNDYLTNNIDELIFINHDGLITESRYFNLIVELNGELFTPALECGLLGGIYRQNLIKTKQAKESKINIAMLEQADNIYLCNDVRGLVKCNYQGKITP